MRNQIGFSLIELILVVAIIMLIGVPAAATGARFLQTNHLQNKVNEVVNSLRVAQINAMSSKEDSNWGVFVGGGQIVLFSGDSYSARNDSLDEKFGIPSSIAITDSEVVFEKLTGNPDSTLVITVANNLGESNTVSVNEMGIVDVD